MNATKFSIIRMLSVGIIALAFAFQIIRSAVALNFLELEPTIASRAWPTHPRVMLAVEMAAIGKSAAVGRSPSSGSIARVIAAARAGPLLAEPFLIVGAEKLNGGDPVAAEMLFREARQRDPRSAAARYFLAQYYLKVGRPVEGLAEASALARLVSGGSAALVPGLVTYAKEPGAIPNLRKMFAANPGLGGQVLSVLAQDASNAPLIIKLSGEMFGRAGSSVPGWQTQLLQSLIERGDLVEAHSLWQRISGLSRPTRGLFNPQFAQIAAPAPFNWSLGSGNFGVAESTSAGQLQVIYYGRDDAQFASQLLLLAPGQYELRMRITRDGPKEAESGLSWSMTCEPGAKRLLTLPLSKLDALTSTLAGAFTVPIECPAQQLTLSGVAREFAKSEQLLISNVQLVGGIR